MTASFERPQSLNVGRLSVWGAALRASVMTFLRGSKMGSSSGELKSAVRNNGVSASNGDLGHDELYRLAACRRPHVVKMCVHVGYVPAVGLASEQRPRTCTLACGIPSHRHLVGRIREPEGAALDHLELAVAVVYCHHLTLGLAILAAYAYAFVVGQVDVEECHLIGTRLLQAEQRRLLVVYHVYGCLLAVLPAVVAVGIGRGAHADVVRYDLDGGRLLRRAARYQRGGAYDKRKDFIHCIL